MNVLNPNANILIPTGGCESHSIGCHAEGSDTVLVTAEDAVMLHLHRVPHVNVVVVGAAHDETTAHGQRYESIKTRN